MILDLVPALLIYVLICLMQKNFFPPVQSRQCRVEVVDPSDLLGYESSCCVNM